MPLKLDRKKTAVAVSILLLILVAQIVHAIRGESLTWDEGDHIFAGYESWKTHDFGFNPEHPPLVKLIATLPLLGLDLKVPPQQGRFFKTEAYMDGRELLFRNSPAYGGRYDPRSLVFRVRLGPLVFSIGAALLVFAAGTEMFGPLAGLLALALFCFEPNLLAHGAFVTTDMAASCTMFATVYAFWRWCKRPTGARLLVVGLAAGLALASKHSTILLLPMLMLVALGVLVSRRGNRDLPGPGRLLAALGAVVVIGVTVLWAFYGFRYAARPAGLALSPSLREYVGPLAGLEARGILFAGRFHLLPESWLYGLADVRAMANGMPSFFFGRVYAHGVWFYFPVLFTIKATLGMLALLVLTGFAAARGWLSSTPLTGMPGQIASQQGGSGRRLDLWFLLAPPGLYLAVAMGSHLNIGARHILPVWVFCCVLAGAGAAVLAQRSRAWAWTVGILLVLHAASTVHAAPNYISYANEAWGGPTHTYRYLSDSNTDWAQQLIATSDYLRAHDIHHCYIAYFAAPFLLPSDYGIPCKRLPTYDSISVDDRLEVPPVLDSARDGPILISAGDLNGFEFGSSVLNPYQTFRTATPSGFIQNGIFVFDGVFPVPLAAAFSPMQDSAALLKAKDIPGSVREAKRAEQIAPGAIQPEIQLGDALAAAGDKNSARAAYTRAAQTIETMEPGAREEWRGTIRQKLQGL